MSGKVNNMNQQNWKEIFREEIAGGIHRLYQFDGQGGKIDVTQLVMNFIQSTIDEAVEAERLRIAKLISERIDYFDCLDDTIKFLTPNK
jgi:hypothetical protein